MAARGGAWAAYLNAGQVCTSAERFYVHESVLRRLPVGLRRAHRSSVVGDPLAAATDVGPMASAPQRRRSWIQVEAAVGAGATLVVGGDDAGQSRGHFYRRPW